jgi:hypothetical protein
MLGLGGVRDHPPHQHSSSSSSSRNQSGIIDVPCGIMTGAIQVMKQCASVDLSRMMCCALCSSHLKSHQSRGPLHLRQGHEESSVMKSHQS